MKKLLFSLLIFLGIFIQSKAQNTFAPVGAEWWYNATGSFTSQLGYAILHAKVLNDTLINGTNCRKITQEYIRKDGYMVYDSVTHEYQYDWWSVADTSILNPIYVYNNEDTVFYYLDWVDTFVPLYIFNMNEGDTVCLIPPKNGNPNPYANNEVKFCFRVDSIKEIDYGGSLLKTIYTKSIYDDTSDFFNPQNAPYHIYNWSPIHYSYSGAYNERFGGIMGGIIPIQQYNLGLFDGVVLNLNLICYKDDDIDFHLTNSCDSLPYTTSVSEFSMLNREISIYPNPANENLTIEAKNLNQDVHITLYDMQGRSIKRLPVTKNSSAITLKTNDITAGVYWLNIQTSTGHYTKKISILH